MSSIKKSNRNLIMLLAGLVILLLVYFLVFNSMKDKTESIESELKTRRAYLTELEQFQANEAEYTRGIEDGKATIAKLTAELPADVPAEDFILYLMNLQKKTEANVVAVSLDDKVVDGQFDCLMDDGVKTVSGGETKATVTATMDYDQLKKVLDYVYDSDDSTFVNAVSVAYDSTTAQLGVVMDLSKLSLDYEGASYNGHAIPKVAKGLDDLFGTMQAEGAEEVTAEAGANGGANAEAAPVKND